MEKLSKVRRVLGIIELYLGVNEEIIQIQEGEKADIKYPICFRQQVLYMDEEVGDPENQGLDFSKIDQFDDWLTKDKNYIKLVPEPKGVVVIRPRRRDKNYGGGWFENAVMNAENKKTYILIRNGENIYRIYAEIVIHPRLFPLKAEMQKLMEDIAKDGIDKEEAEKEVLNYKRNMLMLQGLLDRTEIFKPLPHPVQIHDAKTHDNLIKFIYDGEASLTAGRMYYKDWKEKINKQIKRGTRICMMEEWLEKC